LWGFLFSGCLLKQEQAFLIFEEDYVSDWWLYLFEKKTRYYGGITTNLYKCLKQHGSPKLLYKEGPLDKNVAVQREKQIKKWTRIKKEKLRINKRQES
jgi:predicted GIY-YIG superfamily endonuclease